MKTPIKQLRHEQINRERANFSPPPEDMPIKEDYLQERLAMLAHTQWSGWMKYLFEHGKWNKDESFTISADKAKRWRRQMNTPYLLLSDKEKDSDRIEARKFISEFEAYQSRQELFDGVDMTKLEQPKTTGKYIEDDPDPHWVVYIVIGVLVVCIALVFIYWIISIL